MGLNSGIKEYIPIEEMNYSDLKGKTLAVDAFNSLYQFLSVIRTPDGNLLERNGIVVSHLYGILWRYGYLLSTGVKLIFVFDGKPSAMKEDTIEERRRKKEEIAKEIENAESNGDEKEVARLKRFNARVDDSIIESTKELASLLGIDYIDSPEEGEAEAVHLVKTGFADYVITQDYDAIAYDCQNILRNIGVKKNDHYVKINLVNSSHVFKVMGINREQFLYIAFMTGTDYNKGIYKVGIKRALKIAQKSHSEEDVVSNLIEEGYVQQEDRDAAINELKTIILKFKNPNVCDGNLITRNQFNKEKLVEYLTKLNFNIDRFMPMIDKIEAFTH